MGASAKAKAEGLSVNDALKLLDMVQQAADEVAGAERTELLDAVAGLRSAVEQDSPDTGEVVKKVGKLRAIADKVGIATVSAATGSAASTLIELALNGAFN